MHVLTVICRDGWMSGNLTEGWRRLGCGVEEFFYGTHMGKAWNRQGLAANRATNQQLLEVAERLASEGRLDLIFCAIYDDVLEVDTIRRLRKLGAPVVNYHVDLVGQWYRVVRTGKYFDRIACAHEDHWTGLRRAGARPYYLPMAANPPQVSASTNGAAFDGVVYLGSPWPYRQAVLAQLARAGFPLRIYGNNWGGVRRDASNTHQWRKNLHDLLHYVGPRVREEGIGEVVASLAGRFAKGVSPVEPPPAIPVEAIRGRYEQQHFPAIVAGAAVNVGFTHFRGTPGTPRERRQVRLREFEIPMAGGFYLTQDCAQLRGLYKVGTHLETWATPDDLAEKIRHYLERPDARAAIARSGRAHAMKCHTWAERFRGLLAELSMAPPASAAVPAAQ